MRGSGLLRAAILGALSCAGACGPGGSRLPATPPPSTTLAVDDVDPDVLSSEAPEVVVLRGRGFGPTGRSVDVRFDVAGETPFDGDTNPSKTMTATIESSTSIRGMTPRFGLTRTVAATVTVTLPDGARIPYGGSSPKTVRIVVPTLPEEGMFSTPGPGATATTAVLGADPNDAPPTVVLTARIGTPFDAGESRTLTLEGVWIPPSVIETRIPPQSLTETFLADVEVRLASGAVARGDFLQFAPGFVVRAGTSPQVDQFGIACGVDAGAAAFGAPLDESVYVYARGNGSWPYEARLVATGTHVGDRFGTAVDVSGERIAVGAPGRGSAFVFRRVAGGWTQEAEILDTLWTTEAGSAVAIEGDLLAVAHGTGVGRVLTYRCGAGGWSFVDWIAGYDIVAGDGFAHCVAVDEAASAVAVGAPFGDVNGADSGAVYVEEEHAGSWALGAKVVPADGTAGDNFGFDVAMETYLLAVGAPGDVSQAYAGSVYVFRRVGTSWVQEAKIVAPPGAGTRVFGLSVALDGETLVVGAPADGDQHGALYVYDRAGGAWTHRCTLEPWWPSPYARHLGTSVDVDGDDVVSGAPEGQAVGSGVIY